MSLSPQQRLDKLDATIALAKKEAKPESYIRALTEQQTALIQQQSMSGVVPAAGGGGAAAARRLPPPEKWVDWFLSARGASIVGGGALLGLGALGLRGRYRVAGKFARSLMDVAKGGTRDAIPFMPRPVPFSLTQDKAVIFKAPHLAGKTTLLAHAIKHDWYPWWRRLLFPPRGLFLKGDQSSKTINEWFRSKLDGETNKYPVDSLLDAIEARASQQRLRLFLWNRFPSLPRVLRPQPSLVIIDQTEELIASYRSEFLVAIIPLVKLCTQCPGVLQLVFVVRSDEAVRSLQAINEHPMFNDFKVIDAPLPDTAAVRAVMGDEFAQAFEQLERSVGLTADYMDFRARDKSLTVSAFLTDYKSSFQYSRRVKVAVSKDEITNWMVARRAKATASERN